MTIADQVSARCQCGEELWRKRKGEYVLANKVLALREGVQLVAKCPRCSADVPVSFLQLRMPAAQAPGVRLVARVDRRPKT